MRFIQELKKGLLHLFYPRLCEGCRKPLIAGEEVVCISCDAELAETNYHHIDDNETALRFSGRIPFVGATSLAYFTKDGLLQHLLHGLKYGNKKEIGGYLGHRLAGGLRQTNWANDVDLIIPVPLHRAKVARRGYNQSLLIAEGIGNTLHIHANDNLLLRVRDTESQTNKGRAERVNNMENAFELADRSAVTGKHIMLCDDVLTTGATLEACALALMQAGNVKISIATIGIAVS